LKAEMKLKKSRREKGRKLIREQEEEIEK